EPVTPEIVARVLTHPDGQRKGVTGRFLVVLNQADSAEKQAFARAVAEKMDEDTLILALKTHPDFAEYYRQGKPC
ncbi:MAG: hypothetical protein PHY64_08575, partial [Eubacteriales bacterium]|nr:hypothetical protein [Eubacteriales bacterium]